MLTRAQHVCQQVNTFHEHVLLNSELLGMRESLVKDDVDVFELAHVHKTHVRKVLMALDGGKVVKDTLRNALEAMLKLGIELVGNCRPASGWDDVDWLQEALSEEGRLKESVSACNSSIEELLGCSLGLEQLADVLGDGGVKNYG